MRICRVAVGGEKERHGPTSVLVPEKRKVAGNNVYLKCKFTGDEKIYALQVPNLHIVRLVIVT